MKTDQGGGVTELRVETAKAQMILHCNDPVPWRLPSEYRMIICINGGCDILFMIFGSPHCPFTLMARRGKGRRNIEEKNTVKQCMLSFFEGQPRLNAHHVYSFYNNDGGRGNKKNSAANLASSYSIGHIPICFCTLYSLQNQRSRKEDISIYIYIYIVM